MRTRVKVCGLVRRDDALRAADLGADALGFVFAPGSRRRADPERVARIVEELPPFVVAVGVFRDQPLDEVRALARACRLDLVQLHGSEDMAYIQRLGLRVIKAFGVGPGWSPEALEAYRALGAFLLDAPGGGTGRTIPWGAARRARRYGRVVLAGGLHAGNVAEAVRRVRPWAVDAASGTEAAPGVKDPEKMEAFLRAVREADGSVGDP